MGKTIFLMGNHAVVEGAILAGCRFFAGYPITPSSEVSEYFAIKLPKIGGKFIQMEDEIASIGAIIGASFAGFKAATATSGPGFSLMQEGFGFACMVEIPLVIVNVQRGGPSTGLPTRASQSDFQQARWGTHGDHYVIALSPSNCDEIIKYMVTAFNYAEKYYTPVLFMMDEVISHIRENTYIPDPDEIEIYTREFPTVPPEKFKPYEDTTNFVSPLPPFGKGYRFHTTGLTHNKSGFPTSDLNVITHKLDKLRNKIESHEKEIRIINEFFMDHKKTDYLIVTFGSTTRTAIDAAIELKEKGVNIGVIQLVTLWPFPYTFFDDLKDVKKVFVPEMNMGQLIEEMRKLYPSEKLVGINRYDGEAITPDQIIEKVNNNL